MVLWFCVLFRWVAYGFSSRVYIHDFASTHTLFSSRTIFGPSEIIEIGKFSNSAICRANRARNTNKWMWTTARRNKIRFAQIQKLKSNEIRRRNPPCDFSIQFYIGGFLSSYRSLYIVVGRENKCTSNKSMSILSCVLCFFFVIGRCRWVSCYFKIKPRLHKHQNNNALRLNGLTNCSVFVFLCLV